MAGQEEIRSLEVLVAENAALRVENERLQLKIAELEARLDKSSRNSSLPPSSDRPGKAADATKTRAERRAEEKRERKAAARRRGKQPGADGQHLARRSDPDEVVTHEPERCTSCGEGLAHGLDEGFEVRQVFDVPVARLVCVEHRAVRRRCRCGAVTKATFPAEATAPASYGPNVRAATLYLLHGQHLSVERCAEAISAMLGADVSTGFVASLAGEAAAGLGSFLDLVRRRLLRSAVVHVDETPDQVRTDTWWFHVVADELHTYLVASPTRGKAAPDAAGVLAEFSGVMVHDRLAMYFAYVKATHAICGAHLLRDLASVGVRHDQGWANAMAHLLREMNASAHEARDAGRDRLDAGVLEGFLARYDALVATALAANPAPAHRKRNYLERESYNLAVAFRDLRAEATRFAVDLRVGFTNNEAERSLRMAKLHRKISGCFQGDDSARHFADVRSYLATARKHGVGALLVLRQLFLGEPWLPPAPT